MENRKIYLTNMRSDFFLQRKENDRPKDFSGKIILNSKGFFFLNTVFVIDITKIINVFQFKLFWIRLF